MKITICGSLKFIKEMNETKSLLEKRGHTVLLPLSAETNQSKDYWNKLKSRNIKEFAKQKGKRMKGHFDKIKSSGAILVLNYDKDGKRNYVGPNTLTEMAVAFEHNKKIFILNPLPEDWHYEEIIAMSPVCLEGDLNNLQ